MSSHTNENGNSASSGGYSEDEPSQGPASYALSQHVERAKRCSAAISVVHRTSSLEPMRHQSIRLCMFLRGIPGLATFAKETPRPEDEGSQKQNEIPKET